ncbi:unnamed protein product [Caenorhabditis brenneri]
MTFRDLEDGGEILKSPRGVHEDEQKALVPEKKKSIVVKSRNKRTLPKWLDRPYHVWRDQFQQEKCCTKKMVKRELVIASCCFLLPNVLLLGFILFGTHVFNLKFTTSNEPTSLLDSALFCITTISTIGYGNIVPNGYWAKVICILYCVVGIPLFFLTVATNSVFFVDACNVIKKSFSTKPIQDPKFCWYTSAMLLFTHCFIGSLIFSLWIDELDFLDAFYFSFISITTIGYGDYTPSPEGVLQYTVVAIYLCTGVAIMLLFFTKLQDSIMWIHYYGRKKVSDSEDAEIWYGGQMIHVKDLVKVVAEKFGSTPEKLREVMRDLDKILEVACQQTEDDDDGDEEECRLMTSGEMTSPPGSRKKTIFLSGSSDGDDCQATIHSFTSTNQKSIPKDTEIAIQALNNIQYHLRKPSVRTKGHHPKIPSRQCSENNMETKMHATSLDLRKMAHRVHSDGRLLSQNDV